MSERIIGYAFLIIGVVIILLSAFNVYFVFTGQAQPIHVFNFPAVSLDLGQTLGLPTGAGKPAELISGEMLNQTSNVFAHLFLMGFLATTGQKLASLGVQLVKPINIKINGKDFPAS